MWTKAVADQKTAEQEEAIWDLWLACQTQAVIAEKLGIDQATVSRVSAEIMQNCKITNLHNFGDYEVDESEKSGRRVYNLWNFAKATNEVRHFGNIPPEIG